MKQLSVYILLTLIYLALSKSFSPLEQKTIFVPNESAFESFYETGPVSLILIDQYKTGFLIKTWIQKYLVNHGFKLGEELTVRTTQDFWEKNAQNLGMSLFRKSYKGISTIPMPPGQIFIGDRSYGKWKRVGGEKTWSFHPPYGQWFPQKFGWGDFRPTYKFYQQTKVFLKYEKPFYGMNNEFGTKGTISNAFLLKYRKSAQNSTQKKLKEYLHGLIEFPMLKKYKKEKKNNE